MLGEVFYWILDLGILGSAAGVVVLLLRKFRAFPRYGVYAMWLAVLVRFWVPVGVPSRASLLGLIPDSIAKAVVVWEQAPGATLTNVVQAASGYFPLEYKSEALKGVFGIFGAIWAIVALAAILACVAIYAATKSAVADARHVRDNIYVSHRVLAPSVYGIFGPKIVLPDEDIGKGQGYLEFVLMHEQTHVKRMDNLWRMVAVITACVHWFNPLAWVLLGFFLADMELACDAGVLRRLGTDGRKAYATVLLDSARPKTVYASAFGGAKTRLRIESILAYKRLSVACMLCFAAFWLALAISVISNAAR